MWGIIYLLYKSQFQQRSKNGIKVWLQVTRRVIAIHHVNGDVHAAGHAHRRRPRTVPRSSHDTAAAERCDSGLLALVSSASRGAASHAAIDLSCEPEMSVLPSGEKAREVTRSLCALSSLVTRSSLRPTCMPRGKGQGGRRWWEGGRRGAQGQE